MQHLLLFMALTSSTSAREEAENEGEQPSSQAENEGEQPSSQAENEGEQPSSQTEESKPESMGGHHLGAFRLAFGMQLPFSDDNQPNLLTRGFGGVDVVPVWWVESGYLLRPMIGVRVAETNRAVIGVEFGMFYLSGFETQVVVVSDGEYDEFKYNNPVFGRHTHRLPSLSLRVATAFELDNSLSIEERLDYDFGLVLTSDVLGWSIISRNENDNHWLVLEVASYTYFQSRKRRDR